MTRKELIEAVVDFYTARKIHNWKKQQNAPEPIPAWDDTLPLQRDPKEPVKRKYKKAGNVVHLPKPQKPFDPKKDHWPF